MIIKYLSEAMRRASYKILEDGSYYGWTEELSGVWASGSTLEGCRKELHYYHRHRKSRHPALRSQHSALTQPM